MSAIKRKGILFCLVGPTAGGKSSLSNFLLDRYPGQIKLSISATTRAAREYEIDQEHYYFVSLEQFTKDLNAGKFFETAEVHGNMYGTYKHTVENCINSGQDLLLDIDIQGIRSFKKAFPGSTVVTFIVPPSLAELKKRIAKRSQVSAEELERRLLTARAECSGVLDLADQGLVDYFIVNCDKAHSEKQLSAIYESECLRVQRFDRELVKKQCLFFEDNYE